MHKDPHQRSLSSSADLILRRHRRQSQNPPRRLDQHLAGQQIQPRPQDTRSKSRLHQRTLHPQKARRIAALLGSLYFLHKAYPGCLTPLYAIIKADDDWEHTYTFALLAPCLTCALATQPPCSPTKYDTGATRPPNIDMTNARNTGAGSLVRVSST
jgi:hypothetical protein